MGVYNIMRRCFTYCIQFIYYSGGCLIFDVRFNGILILTLIVERKNEGGNEKCRLIEQ